MRKLVGDRKITALRLGKYTRVYANPGYGDMEKIVIAYLNNETGKKVLTYLAEYPGSTNRELAEAAGTKENAMSKFMAKLAGDNMIRAKRDGNYKKYYLEDDVLAIVNKWVLSDTNEQ